MGLKKKIKKEDVNRKEALGRERRYKVSRQDSKNFKKISKGASGGHSLELREGKA